MITTTVPTFLSLTKFVEFVQLKDFRQPTKDEYVRYVRKLGAHYQCDPATLTEDQVRSYFLFLRQQKQFGGSAMKLARYSLRRRRGAPFLPIPDSNGVLASLGTTD